MNKKYIPLILIFLGLVVILGIIAIYATGWNISIGRDLSSPSGRMIGHWKSGGVDAYFSPIDKSTKIGNIVYLIDGEVFYMQYQVMREDIDGPKITYEVFSPGIEPRISTGKEYSIGSDGLFMRDMDSEAIYEYVDSKTEP